MKKIIEWLLKPFKKRKAEQEFKKRIEELKKRDPFIYK